MSFFERQSKARSGTGIAIFWFIVLFVVMTLILNGIILTGILFKALDNPASVYITVEGQRIYAMVNGHLNWQFIGIAYTLAVVFFSPIIFLIVGLTTLVQIIRLRKGGLSLADMVGATQVDDNSKDFKEKQLVNVTHEMAIAAHLPLPKIYVMKNEEGINAFVSGTEPENTVLVVTQGALNTLNRDALQGVIGHELGHIYNKDMHLSLKLLAWLSGIMIIGQIAIFIIRSLSYSRSRRNGNGKGLLVLFLVALGCALVGYVGVFLGRLIKAYISRQRERLADASSEQFTRNPQGLLQALIAIRDSEQGSHLKSKHADNLNYLCFSPTLALTFFNNLLASHPPIEERIKTLQNSSQSLE